MTRMSIKRYIRENIKIVIGDCHNRCFYLSLSFGRPAASRAVSVESSAKGQGGIRATLNGKAPHRFSAAVLEPR